MSDPALPHPFSSQLAILLKARTGLWACLLSILVLLPACMGMRSGGLLSEKGLGLAPSAGPNLGSQAERLTLPNPISKGQESATSQKLSAAFAQLPLSFIPNRGQVDERVKFYGRTGSASFFFTPTEIVYSFVQREKEVSLRKVGRVIPSEDPSRQGEGKSRGHVVRIQFVGANPDPVIEGQQELPGKVNYFIGRDSAQWKNGLSTYGQIRYRELWPGIDLIYRGQGGRLKYEFIVKPGADPRQVQLAYQGIEGLSISDSGSPPLKGSPLILKTASGELRDSRPVAYQEIGGRRVAVEAGFRVEEEAGTGPPRSPSVGGFDGGSGQGPDLPLKGASGEGPAFVHGFEVKSYDPAYPLILDPRLEYSTFLGGSTLDVSDGIALDGAGNAYVTGSTSSSDFPATAGAFDTRYSYGGDDAFVAKLSSDGSTLLYATFLGGSGPNDEGTGIALDAAGNAYVTGSTNSSDFPVTAGAFDTSLNVGDAFVAKLSSDGSTLLYATFLGGSDREGGTGIALDAAGNAYVTGSTNSSDFPVTAGAFDTSYNVGGDAFIDAFVAKLSSDGSALLYATFLGGSDRDRGTGIALDAAGNAYVTGWTESSDFPTTAGAFDMSYNGDFSDIDGDAFVAKLSSDGSTLLYATFLGGSSSDSGRGIVLDGAGNAYVTGYTNSSDFPTTAGAFDTSHNGRDDAFVAKLSSDGSTLLYATFLGGSKWDWGAGIALDAAGNTYVTGSTSSSDFPTTAGAFDMSLNGSQDAFVAKLSSDGSALLYATFLGGSDRDPGTGIALDAAGNAYVTGYTESSDFPATAGAFDTSYNGSEDVFVAKISTADAPVPAADLALSQVDSPDPVTMGSNLTYTITVTNRGPSAATSVTLTDILPTNVALLSATSTQGSCSGTDTITCNLGTLANGATATIMIVVTPTTAGGISNTASVTASESDPNTTNNVATVVTIINPQQFTLTVIKAGTGSGTVTSSPAGIDCGTDCSESYASGAPVTLIATPAGGSTFAGWRGECSGTNPCTLTMDRARTATAIFTTPLTIGASALEGEVNVPYNVSLGISGGLTPYAISVVKGALPAGLSLNSDGIIGTPTKAGKSSFTVKVTDDLRSSVSKKVSMKVLNAVSIATKNLGKGKVGKKYSATLKAAGGKKAYAWLFVSGSLPEGLGLDPSTGKITGTPIKSGSFNLTLQVTDALGGTASKGFSLNIN